MIKKFATVFAKRLAESAVPSKCKSCECTEDDDTGLPTMECYHCGYPTAVTDYVSIASFLFYYDTSLFTTHPRLLSTARAAFCNPSVQQMVLLREDSQFLLLCSTPSLNLPRNLFLARIYIYLRLHIHYQPRAAHFCLAAQCSQIVTLSPTCTSLYLPTSPRIIALRGR